MTPHMYQPKLKKEKISEPLLRVSSNWAYTVSYLSSKHFARVGIPKISGKYQIGFETFVKI